MIRSQEKNLRRNLTGAAGETPEETSGVISEISRGRIPEGAPLLIPEDICCSKR